MLTARLLLSPRQLTFVEVIIIIIIIINTIIIIIVIVQLFFPRLHMDLVL